MKRFCFLAVLMLLSSFAPMPAVRFRSRRRPSGPDRIIQALPFDPRARRCRSPEPLDCAASVTAMTTIATTVAPVIAVPRCRRQTSRRSRRRAPRRPRPSSPRRRLPSTGRPPARSYTIDAPLSPPPARRQFHRRRSPAPPPPRSRNRRRPRGPRRRSNGLASGRGRASDDADRRLADRRQGNGADRKCGHALCGYVLNSSSNDRGETVLINMKPKTDRQWTGNVYSQDSGETYYGTMAMKGIEHASRRSLRARAGSTAPANLEPDQAPSAESLVTSRQTSPSRGRRALLACRTGAT